VRVLSAKDSYATIRAVDDVAEQQSILCAYRNYEQAVVSERKIVTYLLSVTHRDGRSKAAFFMRFGFTSDSWEILANALRRHVADHEVAEVEETPFGTSLFG
jgi:hypothetical protein